MEEKARQRFLIKLSYQGFLIEDLKESLVLRPRGYAFPAEVIITEDEPNHWVVTGASGVYSYYNRGKHRAWFEALINGLAFQATQEVLG